MFVVTGAAGFIGSVVVGELAKVFPGKAIAIVDRFGTCEKKWKNLRAKSFKHMFSPEEFLDWIKLPHEDVQAVFHMGAISSTTEKDVDLLIANNFKYSQKLWQWCQEKNIPFYYASSGATYGFESKNFSDGLENIDHLRPANPYGWSKQLFDVWVKDQVLNLKKSPSYWAGFKFFNVYGPNEYHKGSQASVVLSGFNQARNSGKIKLFCSNDPKIKDGEQKRDFVYVKDIVSVMLHFYKERTKVKPNIYNLGTGKARTFYDLASITNKALKSFGEDPHKDYQIEFIPMPENIAQQYQNFTQANMELLKSEGGYTKSFSSLEEGINDYVQNYLSKKNDEIYF